MPRDKSHALPAESPFTGFTPDSLEFLRDLAANNDKTWFEANRDRYGEALLRPLVALAEGLAPVMLSIDQEFLTAPGRAVSRIHRDTRFSRDKSPYKTTMWITFKRPVREWWDTPCYFFEIGCRSYRFGMGFYSAAKETMDRLRLEIERRPERFLRAVAFLGEQDDFEVEGEVYKRPLRTDLPEELAEWHRRRNLYLVCNRPSDETLFSRGLADRLRRGFVQLAPFYDFLWMVRNG